MKTMGRLTVGVVGLGMALAAEQPRAIRAAVQPDKTTFQDDLFAGTEKFATGASDVSEVTTEPDGKRKVLSVVRSYEYDKPGMYRIEDVEAYRTKLNTGEWHCSVHTRELKTGESTDVCNKRRTDGFVETAIITVEPKELTFIHTVRPAEGKEFKTEVDCEGCATESE